MGQDITLKEPVPPGDPVIELVVPVPIQGLLFTFIHPDEPERKMSVYIRKSQHNPGKSAGFSLFFYPQASTRPFMESEARSSAIVDLPQGRIIMYDGDEDFDSPTDPQDWKPIENEED